MAKRSKAPTNLGQGIPRVGGELVARLNKLDEGLGTALAYELNHRFSLADVRTRAAAGHAGTVVIAEQARDSSGNRANAMEISGGNIGASSWASQGDQLTPLSQVRSLFTCDHFGGHPSGFPGWFEECVQQEKRAGEAPPPATGDGLVHAMWGYTYEPPNHSDTVSDDPGELEFGRGSIFEYIIPQTTIVDQVTWWKTTVTPLTSGTIAIGLYDLNTAEERFPLTCKTNPTSLVGAAVGEHTIPLTERVTILPGLYALAYIAPCFHSTLSINGNAIPFTMVNRLHPTMHHYAQFVTTGACPDELNTSNILNGNLPIVVPAVYFNDSQEFAV